MASRLWSPISLEGQLLNEYHSFCHKCLRASSYLSQIIWLLDWSVLVFLSLCQYMDFCGKNEQTPKLNGATVSADHLAKCKDMYLLLCLQITWQNERRCICCHELLNSLITEYNQTCLPLNGLVVQPAYGFAFIGSPQNEKYNYLLSESSLLYN